MSRNVVGGRLKIESRSKPFISVVEINDKGSGNTSMRLWLSEEESAECWAGHLQTRDISNWVEKTRMESQQYMRETVSALTGQGEFIIELVPMEDEKAGAELRWKKRVSQDGIVLRMGSAHVQRRTSIGEALEVCVGRVSALEEELEAVRGRCEGLEGERTALADQLEQRCQQQRRMETELFTKFALVLNEKKKMIAELQNPTPAAPLSPEDKQPEMVSKKAPAKRKTKNKVKEEFSLEAEVSSDEADLQPIVTRKRNARNNKPEVVASTSKKMVEAEDEEELYGAETQPMDTQDLLDDF